MENDRNAELINLFDLTMVPNSQESQIVDFAVELFKTLGYVRRRRVACTRKDIPFLTCGEWRHAKMDVCIVPCRASTITGSGAGAERLSPEISNFLADDLNIRLRLEKHAVTIRRLFLAMGLAKDDRVVSS